MKKDKPFLGFAVSAALIGSFLLAGQGFAAKVVVSQDAKGNFALIRDGEPYFIRGAGGTDHLAELVEHGGNSIRTWGIESLREEVDGKPLLDRCEELGITVTAGIWLAHQRHGFDYSDAKQIQDQRDAVRNAVKKYKNHPALLMWGLGNEMEGPDSDGSDPRVWKELNHLAAIVHEEDSSHPLMTVIAGASPTKVKGIVEHYPNIDVLGVNAYASACSAAGAIKAAGWKKPLVLSEFGPSGHWEVATTAWGAAIEPTNREKAGSYYATHSILVEDASDICLGSYCFVWGQKQEKTSTWYGMFLTSGEKLPPVDAMCRAWTGKWPANRCPRISNIESGLDQTIVQPGQLIKTSVVATDPDDDSLQWSWVVQAESKEQSVGGDRESIPPIFPDSIINSNEGEVTVRTPSKPGGYRLFVFVKDGKGAASVDNVCFQVKDD